MSAVAAGLLAARVPAHPSGLGLDLTVAATAPKTLTLRPPGPLLALPGMRAGGEAAEGGVTVVNPTESTERVSVRLLNPSRDAARALMVELSADDAPVYRGPLEGLESPPGRPLVLASGDGFELHARLWLPRGANGWRGHIEDLTLAFDTTPATAR